MHNVARIRRREFGRGHFYETAEIALEMGDFCIVESERGEDYGQVLSPPSPLGDRKIKGPIRPVVRKLTAEDRENIETNRADAASAFETCQRKIEEKELEMKLIKVEYSFDRSRLLFYFTAEGRIDFRELVKELAGIFRTRIELRQIGVRDEARMMGGVGPCGRPLCCATFLLDFEPINIRMAKTQRLPLDPDKISGVCGRLLCCLKYEEDFYRSCSRRYPKDNSRVTTPEGEGKVIDCNFIKGVVTVELLEDDRKVVIPLKDINTRAKK